MIPDEAFIKNPAVPGPTKEEIRCLVMCKSKVLPEDVVVDIGCGTGGLTLEFAKRAKMVYAIDKNIKAVKTTLKNLKKFGREGKVQVIQGNALDVLENIDPFNILIIGGSSGDLSSIIEKGYEKLKGNGRILVTSILLETRLEALKTMQAMGMVPEVVEVFISKGKTMERGTMMLGNNPVAIVSAEKF
jgi:cobalt-precorrin-6B (C15)-methyltransferase